MKYQDELESQRSEDIPVQVEKYRASLLKRMEEKLDTLNEQKIKKKKEKARKRLDFFFVLFFFSMRSKIFL